MLECARCIRRNIKHAESQDHPPRRRSAAGVVQ